MKKLSVNVSIAKRRTSNTLTIIKKEFARFFGDRQLIFTAIIMPGLLIYLIYSFMGTGIESMIQEGMNDNVTLRVENMPQSLAPMFDSADSMNISVVPVPCWIVKSKG